MHQFDDRRLVLRIDPSFEYRQCAGTVHQPRIYEAEAKMFREGATDDALAGGGGAVDSDAAGE